MVFLGSDAKTSLWKVPQCHQSFTISCLEFLPSLTHLSDISIHPHPNTEAIAIIMVSSLRPAFALAPTFKQLPKQPTFRALQSQVRSFHQHPSSAFQNAKSTIKSTSSPFLSQTRNAFRRQYSQQVPAIPNPTASGSLSQRLLYGAAIVGGTVLVTNLVFNRETREDGGMPPFERSYLNETFLHTGLGVGIIGVAARALHQSGWSIRLMSANPWLVMGGGLALSIGSMIGCRAVAPEK